MSDTKKEVLVVVGGGAAGFFCAINVAAMRKNLQVIIVEKTGKILSKVKVSGGGRCNVTHHCFDIGTLLQKYPRGKNLLKKTLHQFSPQDTMDWFNARGVPLKVESDGRVFPVSDTAQTIIDCFLREAQKYQVTIACHKKVENITPVEEDYLLSFADNTSIKVNYVVMATGGMNNIKERSCLKDLDLEIELPVPSLFTFNVPDSTIKKLMGITVEAQVKIVGTKLKEEGSLLITHWGFSGPVVLRLSAWGAKTLFDKQYHFTIAINWLKNIDEVSLRNTWNDYRNNYASQKIAHRNPFGLPNRLWHYLLEKSGVDMSIEWGNLLAKQQNKLIQALTNDIYQVKGKTTFKEEFVTCGGVKITEINPQTMETRKYKNLFFAGELLDVDGITGGFNFQHAWTSAMIIARHIAKK